MPLSPGHALGRGWRAGFHHTLSSEDGEEIV